MGSSLPRMPAPPASRGENTVGMGEKASASESRAAGTTAAPKTAGGEEALLQRWESLARQLAGRYTGAAEREDLEQVARLALLHAARRFDPARGRPFPAYAIPTILGELRNYLRDQERAIRIPTRWWDLYRPLQRLREHLAPALGREPTEAELAAGLGVGEEDVAGVLGANELSHLKRLDEPWMTPGDPEAELLAERVGATDPLLEAVEQQIAFQQVMKRLPPRLRNLLQRRYFQGHSQQEVARELGVSQMQVSRLERQALAQLREELRCPAHGWS
jgi:RNA polymerase sigma-B factor